MNRLGCRIIALTSLFACAASMDVAQGPADEGRAIQAAAKRVAPSVVKIETFGGLETVGNQLVGTGPTTGVVVSEDGYILSSAFNFIQMPSSILVTLPGEKRQPAEMVAKDNSRMLVLLKIETDKKLPVP